jgi:TIR domain
VFSGSRRQATRRLCAALARAGCSPWLDKDKLLPGQNWPRADALIASFSPRSIAKRRQFQSELSYALDCARRLPKEEPFVIPRNIAEQVQYEASGG